MRCVIQRVSGAHVTVDKQVTGSINKGFMILLGIEENDEVEDLDYLVKKISGMRIFEDEEGKMNLNLEAVKGDILLISQFTLYGNTRKGNRPSFVRSARPEKAEAMYEEMARKLRERGHRVEMGVFGAHMDVELVNDGPVTILLDSRKDF
ncbi:MAG: D-tyrosyl-tRNA(Tyr) deacylase [Tissierellia bacterium]|nr:D-tyrosyl-tRNA(Tyr) deacylase [Tissierellia bacterium]